MRKWQLSGENLLKVQGTTALRSTTGLAVCCSVCARSSFCLVAFSQLAVLALIELFYAQIQLVYPGAGEQLSWPKTKVLGRASRKKMHLGQILRIDDCLEPNCFTCLNPILGCTALFA